MVVFDYFVQNKLFSGIFRKQLFLGLGHTKQIFIVFFNNVLNCLANIMNFALKKMAAPSRFAAALKGTQ